MAGYSKHFQEKVSTAKELRDCMQFSGDISAIKGGIEIEFHFQDLRSPDGALSLASDSRVLELKASLNTDNDVLVDEMGGQMGEVATAAYGLQNLKSLMLDISGTRRTVVEAALDHDLKPSPYAVLADYDHDAFLKNIIQPTSDRPERGERQRAMLQGFATHFDQRSVDYPIQNSAIHVSHGATDLQHYYQAYRRNTVLMPFLMMVMENRPPYVSGQKQDTHQGIIARAALGERGLVPDIAFRTGNAEEFVDTYYDHLLSNPMLAYVDGETFRAETDKGSTPPSFKDLCCRDLNTMTNALQALSMVWPSIKMAKIRDGLGNILGERLETRDIDPGLHQPYSTALAVLLPAMDPVCGTVVDDLLASYGFNLESMPNCRPQVMDAFARAALRGNDFLDIPYGNGTMKQFARDYAKIIQFYAGQHGLLGEAKPLIHICETGETDAKVLNRRLRSYDAVLDFQRNYDASMMAGGPTCLSMLEADGKLNTHKPRVLTMARSVNVPGMAP